MLFKQALAGRLRSRRWRGPGSGHGWKGMV